jgi:hypothetical protein
MPNRRQARKTRQPCEATTHVERNGPTGPIPSLPLGDEETGVPTADEGRAKRGGGLGVGEVHQWRTCPMVPPTSGSVWINKVGAPRSPGAGVSAISGSGTVGNRWDASFEL